MNKNLIIGIVVVAIILIGGGAWYWSSQSTATGPTGMMQNNNATKGQMMNSSLKDLLTANQSVNCSFDYTDPENNIQQQGRVYVANQKMRGDFTVTQQDNESFTAHMMNDGEWVYMWGGPMGQNQGTKLKIEKSVETSDSVNQQNNNVDFDQNYNFNCDDWLFDNSMFDLPNDVTFTDLSVQLQQLQQINTQTDTAPAANDQCAACDQVPAEARTQCRQALGC